MRIVVKVGTNVLTGNTQTIKTSVVKNLVEDIFALRKKGHEIILVSSGAVAGGRARVSGLNSPEDKQIWASVGQPLLMQLYGGYAEEFKAEVGQLLILRSELNDRERYNNLVGVLEAMLKAGVLPVINGNDVISKADLITGDNDLLSAMVAVAVSADKLIILTNQKGFFTANPELDPKAELVREVKNVDFELEKLCAGPKSSMGRGGMLSKVRAAKQAVYAGIETFIADGREKGALLKVLETNHIGTKFKASGSKVVTEQKRWMMAGKGFGQLVVDDGAAKALAAQKSLLFPGIIFIRGMFDKGEIVEVVGKTGNAVAYGKTNYGYKDLQNAASARKSLGKGHTLDREVIHRDYMLVLKM